MNYLNSLKKLGLNEIEGKIYLSLLNRAPITVGEISKYSGIYRPTIYKALPVLMQKNLVSQSRKGKRYVFTAEPPASLEGFVEGLKEELDQILPELNLIYSTKRKKLFVHYFEGRTGIEHVYRDLLATCRKGDIIYRYESPKDYKKNKKYYPALYLDRTGGKENEIQKFVITNETTHDLRAPQLDRYSKPIKKEYDLFDYDITQIIYKNKVAFIDYETESATILENERFAKFQQQLFKLLFDKI